MANGQSYNDDPEFKDPQYATVSGSEFYLNGLKSKMIYLKTDPEGKHAGLPQYSNTSDLYFKGTKVGEATQAKVYKDHRMVLDFDWSHTHVNKGDGSRFEKGTVHVQEYKVMADGSIHRLSNNARRLTPAEIALYGEIILHFNPNVKF
ncbi:MAG: hypothetical protein LIO90_01840 [Bacteroidales bacterium]|nr:hypothetical protein [Bacteroidales bacterium]